MNTLTNLELFIYHALAQSHQQTSYEDVFTEVRRWDVEISKEEFDASLWELINRKLVGFEGEVKDEMLNDVKLFSMEPEK